ncbi:uncharacterized protein LOC113210553 [Frankliniella occidentalis]|uniref:Uncharacterized protein LOC113210553 n=1 Tax=Frankliniella occidentalis TaxID=133901 RepID=A0A6J1T111_FRAOC|nr:uncharacterized protein LOC113210553 [Frankliniella occidentalis]
MAAKSSALADFVQCPLCFEQFDMQDRLPKLMNCGHTYCLDCLTRHVKMSGGAKTCPKCRQVFSEAPFFLKNNFHICETLSDLEARARAPGACSPSAPEMPAVSLRFFCTRCNRDANDSCLMKMHPVCDKTGLVLKRATEAKEQAKRQFQREDGVLKDLAESLEAFAVAINGKGGLGPRAQREMGEVKKQREVLDKTSKLVMEVPLTAFQDNGDVPRALDRFLQANSERLFALQEQKSMLDMAKKCTVTVRADDTGLATGTSKTLAIGPGSPAEDRVLSYLIYLLLHGQDAAGSSSAVPSLDTLIADVKKCIIDGDVPDNDEDDSDSDGSDCSDTSSVVSEAASIVPDNCKNAKKVFVGRIPKDAKPEQIKDRFSTFGKILYVRFLTSPIKAEATGNHCALLYVSDDKTVQNILRSRPITLRHLLNTLSGQKTYANVLLNVQEDRTGQHKGSGEAKQQRRQKRLAKKKGGPSSAPQKGSQSNQDNEAARRVFANQVPLDSAEADLANFFSKYGPVASVTKRRHGVGQKCMAFITFRDDKSVARVLGARPIMYNGFDLQVREYDNKTPRRAAQQQQQQQSTSPMFTPPTSNPQMQLQAITAATAANAAALSALCVSNIDQHNKNYAQQQPNQQQQQGPNKRQPPQPNKQPQQQQKPKQKQQPQQPQQQPQQQLQQLQPQQLNQSQPQQRQQKPKGKEDCCVM